MSSTEPPSIQEIFRQHLSEVQFWQSVATSVGGELAKAMKHCRIRGKVESRAKTTGSVIGKYYRKGQEYQSLADYRDLAGARVLVPFVEDVDPLVAEIRSNPSFEVIADERKIRKHDRLSYQAHHLDVKVSRRLVARPGDFDAIRSVCCEIQVQTLAQSLWANTSHLITYKRDLPADVLRRVNRLVVLCELFDDEATESKALAIEHLDVVDRVVNELDRYFFGITGATGNLESSAAIVRRLLPSLGSDPAAYESVLESFVQQYGSRLSQILTDRPEARDIFWLLRPEVLLIFERLTNAPIAIRRIWSEEFSVPDLDALEAAWGPVG